MLFCNMWGIRRRHTFSAFTFTQLRTSQVRTKRAKITRSPCFGRYSCAAIAADPTRAAATTASPYVGNESTTPVSPATGALPGTAWKVNRDGL